MNEHMVRWIAILALTVGAAGAAAPPERPAIGKIARFDHAAVYLPRAAATTKVPLLIIFPGTGGRADPMLRMLQGAAETAGFALAGFSPTGRDGNFETVERFFDDRESRRPSALVSWPEPILDAESERILQTVDVLVATGAVDPARIGLLGYSHGGSFALSLGLSAPQRFRSIAALSPGILLVPKGASGGQFIFLAHGKADPVQPYRRAACSFVPKLEALGYAVRFADHPGGHELDGGTVREALAHFLASGSGNDPGLRDSQPTSRAC